MANYKAVGRITGSPLHGLCERMCINVDCVIDACRTRRDGQTASVTLTDFPAGRTAPFTFVSAEQSGEALFSFTGSNTNGTCRRISGNLQIPMTVTFSDANGLCGTASGILSLARDVVLRVPQDNTEQYRFSADARLICVSGAFLTDDVVSLSFCIAETYRTIVSADILVPTYGFAVYPDCEECDGCTQLMNSSLFPEDR